MYDFPLTFQALIVILGRVWSGMVRQGYSLDKTIVSNNSICKPIERSDSIGNDGFESFHISVILIHDKPESVGLSEGRDHEGK